MMKPHAWPASTSQNEPQYYNLFIIQRNSPALLHVPLKLTKNVHLYELYFKVNAFEQCYACKIYIQTNVCEGNQTSK